jgi:potassium channel subfamily K, other eukaryote
VNLNLVSLACGFLGNLFLLFNFTRFVRYIIALPATIILWFTASGILMGITIGMHLYSPPVADGLYSQGYWHAVIAAVLYFSSASILMINMLGYSLGHYTQHFELTEEQRNLILQTMMFFIWLAGGAGVFARVSDWAYADALYFCDVTVLTVGFGDFYAVNDVARGLVFPYSVGGIIMLGLMVSSINKFASEIGHNKIVRGHVERRRAATMERSVTTSFEAERRLALENAMADAHKTGVRPQISAPFNPEQRTIIFDDPNAPRDLPLAVQPKSKVAKRRGGFRKPLAPLRRTMTWASEQVSGPATKGLKQVPTKKGRLIVLKEEKDRFLAMRAIQSSTRQFKRYFALCMSVIAFGLLWCVGALVFWLCEQRIQGMTYFQGLYFCYVSLLTIGYGDLSPKSNAGKPFFIVWSLIAVPTMTILISDMGDTVVAAYKRGTFTLAAWTILPSKGFFREFLERHPWIMAFFRKLQAFARARERKHRLAHGFPVGPEEGVVAEEEAEEGEIPGDAPTLEQLVEEEPDEHELARRLALAIRRTADHLKEAHHRRYTYEEWVEYSRLIRFSDYPEGSNGSGDGQSKSQGDSKFGQLDRGIVDWDWIGEDSPMMSDQPESEWVLDRLCESLDRYMQKQLPKHVRERHRAQDAVRRRQLSITSGGAVSRFANVSMEPTSPTINRRDSVGGGNAAPGGFRLPPRRWSVTDGLRVPQFANPSRQSPRRLSLTQFGLDHGRLDDAVSTGRRSSDDAQGRGGRSRSARRRVQDRGRSIEATLREANESNEKSDK